MSFSYKGQFDKEIPWLRVLTVAAGVLLVTLFAMVLGGAVALELHKVIVVILGGLVGLLLLTLPSEKLLIILWVISIFIVGQIHYFGGFKQANWIPFLFGFILYFKVYSAYISDPLNKDKVITPVVLAVLSLFMLVLISSIINGVSMLQAILGSRNYVFLWSIFFLIVYSGISLSGLTNIWKGVIFVIIFQIPLVIYQKFIVATERIGQGDISWDSVVGGFGGDAFGGGASPALAFFLILGIVYFTVQFRQDLLSKKRYVFYILLTFPSILLSEIKVIFVLIPLALFFVFFDKIKINFLKFISVAGLLTIVLIIFMSIYEYQKRGNLEQSLDLQYLYEQTFANQLDPAHVTGFGQLGRVAIVLHWWDENGFDQPVKTLLGYGIGATAMTPLYVGETRAQYPYVGIDRSVIAILLWELGLLGVLIFGFILLRASLLSFRASKSEIFDCNQRVTLQVTSIMLMLVFLIMLLYSTTVFYIPAVNLSIVFLVGYAVYCYRLVIQGTRFRGIKKQ